MPSQTIRVDDGTFDQVARLADEHGMTRKGVVEMAVRAWEHPSKTLERIVQAMEAVSSEPWPPPPISEIPDFCEVYAFNGEHWEEIEWSRSSTWSWVDSVAHDRDDTPAGAEWFITPPYPTTEEES